MTRGSGQNEKKHWCEQLKLRELMMIRCPDRLAHQIMPAMNANHAMMMMISHQMRHGRQDNHATNHVRCTKTHKAGQSRRHIEAKQSKTIYL
jgi:hypothetical protein